MWTREKLKDQAKFILGKDYWKQVLVALIGGIATYNYVSASMDSIVEEFIEMIYNNSTNFYYLMGSIIAGLLGVAFWMAIMFLVFLPLAVGTKRYTIFSLYRPTRLGEMGYAFKNNYWNVVLTYFLKYLFLNLWSLLFIIPGIIKSYEYRMIPYLLAEDPGMNYKDAFRISKQMMMGEKWNAFVLDLSFLGWNILSVLTLGILSIFYVSPYNHLTNAALYVALKPKVFRPVQPDGMIYN